ncbi:YadA-like family protein [Photobacterium phosphoreum]|uniref:YadA-like family protein n=1 Tax=Photobacterium phosphoreum TaxID=659 RepID=UPI000D16456E|nr:YadA-like family protein [Photobacterium phosphoreum]PSU58181.1 hypothetical protein CTM75_17125 [Photobacterium phosphoreum]
MNKTILALSLTSALAATSVMAKNQPAVDFGMGATTAQKIQAMNAWATENGYHSQIINDNGTIKVRRAHYDDNGNLVRYEQWNIERELTDENGNFDHQKLENTLRYALSRAQKAGRESPNGVKPIDVIIEPVHPVSTKDKIKIVNKLLTASGLESRIEGTTLTFQHPDGFEVSIDLATASTEQLTKIKLGATEAFSKKIDQRRNNMPTIPESPIIDPIDGSKIIKTGAELVSELNKIATGGQGQTFINEYLQADADTKKKLASNLIDAANSDENLKRQLQQLTFEVPSAVNGEPQTITLYQFMDDIQNDVQDPIVSKMTPKEIQLRGAGLNLLHAGNNLQQYGKNLHDKLTTKFAQADADFDNLIQKITVAEDTLRNTATKTQTQLITEFDTIDQQLAAITAITTNNTAAIDHNTDSVTAMIDGLKTARDATGNIITMIGKEVQQTQQAINELTDGLIVTKDAASQILNQLNTLQNTNISNNTVAIGELTDGLKVARDIAADAITRLNALQNNNINANTDAIGQMIDGLKVARDVAATALTELNTRQNTTIDTNTHTINTLITELKIAKDAATDVITNAAIQMDATLSAHLSTKEQIARIELTKSKVQLLTAANNMDVQLTTTINNLQSQIDTINDQVGIPGPIDEGLIAGLERAKNDIEAELLKTNTKIDNNQSVFESFVGSLTTGLQTAKTEVESWFNGIEDATNNLNQAGHNAVDLLQTQRTNDIEKLSTYLNSASYNAQSALTNHLNGKEDNAKIALGEAKQSLILAAEYANNTLSDEITTIYAAITAAEQGSTEALDAVVVGLQQARKQLDANINVMNMAISANTIRMDNAKIALETAANDAELALQAFLSGKEGQARVELTTAKGNLQVAAINMQDQLTKTFTQAQSSLTDVVNDLQAQLDRLSSGEEGTNPPQQDAELRQGLITAGTELKDKMAIAKQHLTDASDDINDAIAQTNTAVLTNTNNIQTLSQTVTAGTVAITTAAETLNQAGHNAVNLLQQQRTSDIEKLSTYLNSASYNAQRALTNHLNGKEDNAKIALGEAKQSLILAAEYANNTLSGEINNIYAAITAAEQGSTEALNAVVTGLQQARDQLDTNFNVMNMAISANTIRMDSADIALTTAAQNLNQAGHNAVDLLQTQRTNDIEKLSTYLNSASYNAQLALTNHLDNKENNAKVALSKAKQSLTFAAEYANNALTGEINNIYAAITAAEQGSNEALDAVVVGLEVAKKQLKANLNVMNTAINSNAIRMDAGKAKLTEVASSAESQLMATIAALEERLDLLESTPDTVKATEEQQIALESGLQNAATVMIEKSQAASTAMVKGISNLKTAGKALKSHLQSDSISIASTSERQHSSSSKNTLATTYITSYNNDVKQQLSNDYQSADATTLNSANDYTDQQVTFLNDRMDNLEADMDNVMATSQAVTAARPYLLGGQTSAIGVGLGGSGDAAAIAIGYAQRLNDNWTVNGNISGTQGNDVNVSVGVGASYAW